MDDSDLCEIVQEAGGSLDQWGIYVEHVGSGMSIQLQSERSMDTMSAIKLPLLLHLLALSTSGDINLHKRIRMTSDRKRFGTGVLSSLDTDVEISLGDAAVLMITVSDNAATDIVFDAVGGPSALNDAMASAGLAGIEACGTTFDWFRALASSMDPLYAEFGPEELFLKGYPYVRQTDLHAARSRFHFEKGQAFGLATAADLGKLLGMLVNGEYFDKAVCEQALRILGLQTTGSRIPRYLPPGAFALHKTGDFTPFIANDVGVICAPDGDRQLIVCMLSAGNKGSWGELEEVCSRVSEKCYLATR